MSHLGRDFSSYQGALTDADVEGIDFMYVKATEGATYKNPDAVQQVAMGRKHGVKVGYYHFLDEPGSSIGDQLQNFHLFAQALGETELPLAVDSEQRGTGSWQQLASDIMQFAMNVEGWNLWVPNPRSLLYVNLNFYENLPGFPWGRWVWLANPGVPAPQKPCLVWQQAPRPVSSTDLKSVDPDVFMGSDADWAEFTRTQAPVAEVAQVGPVAVAGGPGGEEMYVIGQMIGPNGLYQGFNVSGGKQVFAGAGNPTTWWLGWNAKALPVGTPIAVAYADKAFVGTEVVTEYL